jgi:hypothetical protein
LWIGDRLGPLERATKNYVLRAPQLITHYIDAQPSGEPDGVEEIDSPAVLPHAELMEVSGGRADLYSDWFRYELLRRGRGTWVDTDVYVLGPIDAEKPCLFGEQSPGVLNNAVLRVPPDSALLNGLIEPFERRTTPSWLPWSKYLPMRAREFITGRADLTRAPWGTTSPHALTAVARTLKLDRLAEPVSRFYPVPWQRADWILDPHAKVEDVTTAETVAIHLWNERIRSFKDAPAPPGSFLHRLQQEGADQASG